MNMKMTTGDYRKQLKEYTLESLFHIRSLIESLELKQKNHLTIEVPDFFRAHLQVTSVPKDCLDDIFDSMVYDWHIFYGDYTKLPWATSNEVNEKTPVMEENLRNLHSVVDQLIYKKSPQKIAFLFDNKRIYVRRAKERPLFIGKGGNYREGLLRALTDSKTGQPGFIKDIESVIESINLYKKIKTKKNHCAFIMGVFREIQRNLKAVHLGGIFSIKWHRNNKLLQLTSKN
jgi:hypothetical protein